MKKIIILLLAVASTRCTAQQTIPFANFIQTDTSVAWAAICNSFVDLTPANPNFSVRNFYLDQLRAGKLSAYVQDSIYFKVNSIKPVYNNVVNHLTYAPFDPKMMNWDYSWLEHDYSGQVFALDSNNCDACLNANRVEYFKVKQLLYYQDHQLRIKNILAAPVVYTKRGMEDREAASYAILPDFAFDTSEAIDTIPPGALFIRRAANYLDFHLSHNDVRNGIRVMTVSKNNLFRCIVEDAKNNQVQLCNPYNKEPVAFDRISFEFHPQENWTLYDSLGNAVSHYAVAQDLNLDSVYHFQLTQDFYFDFAKEKLYSKLVGLVAQKYFKSDDMKWPLLFNYLDVVFPKPGMKLQK